MMGSSGPIHSLVIQLIVQGWRAAVPGVSKYGADWFMCSMQEFASDAIIENSHPLGRV